MTSRRWTRVSVGIAVAWFSGMPAACDGTSDRGGGTDGGARVGAHPAVAPGRRDASRESDGGTAADASIVALDASAEASVDAAAADAAHAKDATDDARRDGASSGFGRGFTELIAPIEGAIPLHIPTLNGGGSDGATVGIIRDIDGDGTPEIVLTAPRQDRQAMNPVLAYDSVNRSLSVRPSLGPMDILAVLDLDDDGNVDLVSRQPFGIAWGLGGGTFGQVVEADAIPQAVNAIFDDVDRDGWLDIVTDVSDVNASRDLAVQLRDGPRTFSDHSSMIPVAPHTCPAAVASGDLHVDEKLLMVLGTPCEQFGTTSSGIYRENGRDALGYPTFEVFDPTPPGLAFVHIDSTEGLNSTAPMGAAFDDLDDDGFPELSITVDPFTTLFAGGPSWPLSDKTMETGFARVPGTRTGTLALPWGIAFADVDQDGLKDAIAAHGNDISAWIDPKRYIGPQHVTIHRNLDGQHFSDITEDVGVGRLGQWKSLAVGDLDGDGDADFIVGGQTELPRVYRNDIDVGNHGFSLRLHGTSSNHLGVGTRVEVTIADGSPVQRYVAGGIGATLAVSEPLVFVGLGHALSAKSVRITWPSGTVQELHDVAAGALHAIEEPPLFTVSPRTRHQPADGTSECVLTISPRDLGGSTRSDATIAVVASGGGTVAAPVRHADGTFEVHVVAPASPGATVIEIDVDGVPSGIRPRLFWD